MHATSVNKFADRLTIRYTSVHYSSCASVRGARSYLESSQRLQWASKIACTVRTSVGRKHGALWIRRHLSVPPPVPAPQQLLWSCNSSPITCTCRRIAFRLTARAHWTLHLPPTVLARYFGHKLTQPEYQRERKSNKEGRKYGCQTAAQGQPAAIGTCDSTHLKALPRQNGSLWPQDHLARDAVGAGDSVIGG